MESVVHTAIHVIAMHKVGTRDEELLPALLQHGLSGDDAKLALLFLPIPFGRVILERFGMKTFSDEANVIEPGGARFVIQLSKQPIYAAASAIAEDLAKRGAEKDAFGAVAARSAEVAAALKARDQGTDITKGRIGSPLFPGYERRLFV